MTCARNIFFKFNNVATGVAIEPKTFSGLNQTPTHDLCDSVAKALSVS